MNGSKALAALAAAGIEADASTGTRARYSTDAGLYRIPPEVVVFPRDTDQVLRALEIARGLGVPITTRGGGTSCAGNSIGPGAVIDFSRHMNRVLSIDPRARTATVEPGCIGSTLQEAARAHGLRFGPDPSSQNRASIGGMVGNNACGPHATAWGRTSDNIVSMECVDGRGRRFTASSRHGSAIPEVPGLAALIGANLAPIRRELGSFGRQVSGYSLEHLTPEGGRNLAAMLTGSEGTLVTLLSVTVRLVPLPTAPVLVALGYPGMIEAADDVPTVLEHSPLARDWAGAPRWTPPPGRATSRRGRGSRTRPFPPRAWAPICATSRPSCGSSPSTACSTGTSGTGASTCAWAFPWPTRRASRAHGASWSGRRGRARATGAPCRASTGTGARAPNCCATCTRPTCSTSSPRSRPSSTPTTCSTPECWRRR